MATVFYVYLGDKQVEGPFATREEASRRAADLATNEVGLNYRVKRVTET